jgi:hypothetical protein
VERLKRFFNTIVRRAFWELGIAEQPVVEHVSDMLTEFANVEHVYRMRSLEGKRIDSLVDMMRELPGAGGRARLEREREVRCYIGNYSLFMSGMFRAHAERGGYLDFYMETGRRSYWAVSEFDLALYRTGFLLFQDLSKRFEIYAGALDYVRKAYFAPYQGEHPYADFLQEVDGWVQRGLSRN